MTEKDKNTKISTHKLNTATLTDPDTENESEDMLQGSTPTTQFAQFASSEPPSLVELHDGRGDRGDVGLLTTA